MVRHPNRFHSNLIGQLRKLDHLVNRIESVKAKSNAHTSSSLSIKKKLIGFVFHRFLVFVPRVRVRSDHVSRYTDTITTALRRA
jgi:hypothetical protein